MLLFFNQSTFSDTRSHNLLVAHIVVTTVSTWYDVWCANKSPVNIQQCRFVHSERSL